MHILSCLAEDRLCQLNEGAEPTPSALQIGMGFPPKILESEYCFHTFAFSQSVRRQTLSFSNPLFPSESIFKGAPLDKTFHETNSCWVLNLRKCPLPQT